MTMIIGWESLTILVHMKQFPRKTEHLLVYNTKNNFELFNQVNITRNTNN